ncbi:MAG: hypothetical protein KGL42_01680 [Betaproteobacteria bacterium]|nr:hypothetical protein [Betaproteobacteria bacterium]
MSYNINWGSQGSKEGDIDHCSPLKSRPSPASVLPLALDAAVDLTMDDGCLTGGSRDARGPRMHTGNVRRMAIAWLKAASS